MGTQKNYIMKKSILTLTVCIFLTTVFWTSCNSPAQKVENAKENVDQAAEDLEKAKAEYMADVERYRQESAEKIAANNQAIVDFKAKVNQQKQSARAQYNKSIAELEQKNKDLQMKLEGYKDEGKDKWDAFKMEFNHDMEELGQAFSNLGKDNK